MKNLAVECSNMSEVVTLMVGDNAPDFEAPLTDGSKFVLSEVLDLSLIHI